MSLAGALVLLMIYAVIDHYLLTPRIAYVNTGKLLVGFSESAKVDRELKSENDKWQNQIKQLEDSLQLVMNQMSKEYDKAPVARKKELQDMLSSRNQQINNFRQANIRNMEKIRLDKMQSVFDKANVFMTEYGKKHNYGIILGTVTGGSILYGDEGKYDITDDIIKGLNERYK